MDKIMTQNIEQRTVNAVKQYETASDTIDKFAHADDMVHTPVGARKTFPKISKEWEENAAALTKDWKEERDALSIKSKPVLPWAAGETQTDLNQQRRFIDGHTYLPKTVPALMNAEPDDNWIAYTADKSDVLSDVFGSKPVDLVSGLVITPIQNQYPKLAAFGSIYEIADNSVSYTVKGFTQSVSGLCAITLSDDSVVIAVPADVDSKFKRADQVYSRNFKTLIDLENGLSADGQNVDLSKMIGQRVEWRGRFEESDGGSNWGVICDGNHIADGGEIISLSETLYIKANVKGQSINIRKFGARGNGIDDDTIPLRNAITAAFRTGASVVIPSGDFVQSDSMLNKRGVSVSGTNLTSRLLFVLPDNSNLTCVKMAVAMTLSKLTVAVKCTGYAGVVIDKLSSYQEGTRLEKGGVSISYFDARLTNLEKITIQHTDAAGEIQLGLTAVAVRIMHDGLGINQWGHGAYKIRITGGFEWAFQFINDQQQVQSDSVRMPWINGYTVSDVSIDCCKNGFLFDTRNSANNTITPPDRPANHKFTKVQMQCVYGHSERFAKILSADKITFDSCTPWDWDRAADGFKNKPYFVGRPTAEPAGGAVNARGRINGLRINDLWGSEDNVEFEPDLNLYTYGADLGNYINYGGYGQARQSFPESGRGTNGVFTYRDLWEQPVGLYWLDGTTKVLDNLKLSGGFGVDLRPCVLEVIGLYQGRRLFRVYKETIGHDVREESASQMFFAYTNDDVANETDNTWLDSEIQAEFWRDQNGRSPNDSVAGYSSHRPTNCYVGQAFFDRTINKPLWWSGTAWVDAVGAAVE